MSIRKTAAAISALVVTCLLNNIVYGQFIVERVGGDYTRPTHVAQPAADFNNLFIVERGDGNGGLGRIARRDQAAGTTITFLNFKGQLLGAGGVISMAFHPEFATNGLFYVALMDGLTNHVLEYLADPNNLNQPPTLNRTLLTYENVISQHTIDWMGFRPGTDELFLTTGDGGSQQANHSNFNQSLIESPLTPWGKLMRFDLVEAYDPPANSPEHPGITVFALGMRNPFRASFCPDRGMFLGDVGFLNVEEINYIPPDHFDSDDNPPVDFGWADREGTISTVTTNPDISGERGPNDIDPIFDYLHHFTVGDTVGFQHKSIIRGNCIIAGHMFQGRFYFANYPTHVYSGLFDTGVDPTQFDGTNLTDIQNHTSEFEAASGNEDINGVTSFAMDNAGSLYFMDQIGSTGEIFRLVPTTVGDVNQDGAINLLDVGPFIDVLSSGEYQFEADIDGNGVVNLLDVDPFSLLLSGG